MQQVRKNEHLVCVLWNISILLLGQLLSCFGKSGSFENDTIAPSPKGYDMICLHPHDQYHPVSCLAFEEINAQTLSKAY